VRAISTVVRAVGEPRLRGSREFTTSRPMSLYRRAFIGLRVVKMSVSRYSFEKPDEVRESLLTRCRETIESLSEELEEERSLRIQAEAAARDLRRQLTQLEDQFEDCNVKLDLQSSEYSQMQLSSRDVKRTLTALQDDLASAKGECGQLQSHVKLLLKEKKSLVKRLEQVQGELAQKDQVMDDWNKAVSHIEDKVRQLTAENEGLKKDLEAYVHKCKELLTQTDQLNQAWGRSQEESAGLSAQLSQAKAELLTFPGELEERRETWLSQWKEEHAELLRDVKMNCLDQVSLAESKASRAEENCGELRMELRHRSLELEETQTQLKQVLARIEQLEQAHRKEQASKDSSLKALKADLRTAEDTVSDLQGALEAANQELRHERTLSQDSLQHQEQLYSRLQFKDSELARLSNDLALQRNDFEKAVQRLEEQAGEYERHWQAEQRRVDNDLAVAKAKVRHEAVQKLKQHKSIQDQEWQQRKNELEDLRQEVTRSTEDYAVALNSKEEEVGKLNADREKLRGVLEDVELKLRLVTEKYGTMKNKFKSLAAKYRSKDDALTRLQTQLSRAALSSPGLRETFKAQ
jgi:chromosome segregation ATPase